MPNQAEKKQTKNTDFEEIKNFYKNGTYSKFDKQLDNLIVSAIRKNNGGTERCQSVPPSRNCIDKLTSKPEEVVSSSCGGSST